MLKIIFCKICIKKTNNMYLLFKKEKNIGSDWYFKVNFLKAAPTKTTSSKMSACNQSFINKKQ